MKDDFLIDIDGGVEPYVLFVGDLDLLLIDGNAIRSCGELLIAGLRVVLVPVIHRLAGTINAEPLEDIGALCQ